MVEVDIRPVISQQTHQYWINVEKTLIINNHQPSFNVDIWLKMKAEKMCL